jgi:hypothetical protein
MRALRSPIGAIPRGFKDHRRREGRIYAQYCRAVQQRFGPLSQDSLPLLRIAGRLVVELGRLDVQLDAAYAARRYRVASRLRRQQTPLRTQLLTFEHEIEQRAKGYGHGVTFADVVRAAETPR